MTDPEGWAMYHLVNHLRAQTRIIRRYNAIYAPPPRRWTFFANGMWRTHEYYLRASRLLEIDQAGQE